MSTQTEAMKLALEALEDAWLDASMGKGAVARHSKAITALREALAEQPAQEPFGYFKAEPFGWTDCAETDEGAIALYTTPQAQPAPVQGWKLVPVQPTDQMRDAGNVIIGDRGALFAAYHAMLAVAPQAPKENT